MSVSSFKLAVFAAVIFFAAFGGLWGCRVGPGQTEYEQNEKNISVVVTLSFFKDMVQEVAENKIELNALVPVGVEPENYDPTPDDIRAIKNADVFIYNGYNVERWLPRIITDIEEKNHCHSLAEHPSIKKIFLPSGPFKGEPDPHAWTNVEYAVIYVEQIASILSKADPENEEFYQRRAESYIEELEGLHQWIKGEVKEIPRSKRVLITSELCFQYFAEAYGFRHDAIWPINAPEEGTPAQIVSVVELVEKIQPPAVFVENQVDPRPMKQVSTETGVPIGGVLFSDSLSEPGKEAETYMCMMKSNVRQIIEALTNEERD